MNEEKYALTDYIVSPISMARWMLLFLLIAAVYFFHGFIVPVLAALVIGFASWPIYRRLNEKLGNKNTLSATIAIIAILLFIIIPISIAINYAAVEIAIWAKWLLKINKDGSATPEALKNIPLIGIYISELWDQHLGQPHALQTLASGMGINISNLSKTVLAAGTALFSLTLTLLFMMITLFFVYKNGSSSAGQVNRVGQSILGERWLSFSRVVPDTISSTVIGMTVIAIGEGFVLGIAYWIAGVPSPLTFGVITGFMALIPGGAPLSFTLISLYLVGEGKTFAGTALFLWGTVELFIVDKTLRPRLVGGPIKLPFLPTFFGLIGGVKTMGFLGLFLGPVLMALLISIWREWLCELEKKKNDIT